MNEEIINKAVETFLGVPEVYQQIFKELGSDFSDEMVASIKQNPEEATKMLQSDNELLNSVCTIYSKYAEDIDSAYEEAKSQTKMFKVGGKLQALFDKTFVPKKQEGGPIMAVYPDTFWEKFKYRLPSKLYDLPKQGIYDRDIIGKVDPKTGKQKYHLREDVRGDTIHTYYDINPAKRDTVIM